MNKFMRLQNQADKMFRRNGEMVEVKIIVDKYRNQFTGETQGSEIIVKVPGIVETTSEFLVDNTNVKSGDKTISISAKHGIPLYGSDITAGGQLHRILNVNSEVAGGVPIYYTIKCRSYALVDDLDALIVPLSEVALGSYVVDPNRQDTPIWIVVAHNHYKAYQTTLMTWECVTDNVIFKGPAGNWNTAPWSETYMRRWLLNDFRNTLSVSMIKNLQPFTTVTQTQRVVDTISIASNHELGATKNPGTDNGDVFEYFDLSDIDPTALNAQRIAAYNNINTAYWTRGASGINTDGSIATLNPNYGHGVRPIINLLSGISATYNSGGEYELKFS